MPDLLYFTLLYYVVVGVSSSYGLRCELSDASDAKCVLQSPQNLLAGSLSQPCLKVRYQCDDDVKLEVSVLVGGSVDMSQFLPREELEYYVNLTSLSSMSFTLRFTAIRYLTSFNPYEEAVISKVQLLECPEPDTGASIRI